MSAVDAVDAVSGFSRTPGFRPPNPQQQAAIEARGSTFVSAGDGTGKHDMGAIYDLAAATKNASRGTGKWNTVEITCKGPEISVKLNGQEVSSINCDDFDKPGVCPDGQPHKFKLKGQPRAIKDFARKGYVGFQDHGHKVWYKNVKLLELKN